MGKKYQLHLKGFVGDADFDASYVDYILGKNEGKEVNVLIDSLGGRVDTALSISSAFRRHGKVNVHYVGMNASAATIAGMGAKKITMASSAMYLVHKCSDIVFKWASLNADEIASFIEELQSKKNNQDAIDTNIAALYSSRCKKDKNALLELMKVGGWLSSAEALEWGFVDEVIDESYNFELTESTVAAMQAAGMPIPDIEPVPDSFWRTCFANFLNKASRKKSNTMKKTFTNLCALLSLDALIFSDDGKITMDEKQFDDIERELGTLHNEIRSLKGQLQERDNRIAELEKEPGAQTSAVVDAAKPQTAAPYESFLKRLSEVTNLYNKLP